ncbi:MAG: endonuclease domain-containing protein, partial [candidate division WOR-3 bacterium]|nr:endonuclease domain-containing protein [candidate division WOR-3 bacterium]
FYLPKIFGEEKYSVKYYAKVKNIEIVKRIKLLPEEKEDLHANDDYYKLTIDEIKPLPQLIVSKRWRRITFIPTTLSKLFSAKEINDLWCTSPIEEILYKKMKREKILAERQFFVYETKTPYCLDFAIFCRDGKLNIECNGEKYHSSKEARIKDRKRDNDLTSRGWSILRFSGEEINKDINSCIRQIKKTIKTLQGY